MVATLIVQLPLPMLAGRSAKFLEAHNNEPHRHLSQVTPPKTETGQAMELS